MSDKHNIYDEQLRKAMEGFEGEVSMSAWDAIESSLDKSDRRRKFFWYFSIASVLIVIAGLVFILKPNPKQESISQSDVPALQEERSDLAPNERNTEEPSSAVTENADNPIATNKKEQTPNQTQLPAPTVKSGDRASQPVRSGSTVRTDRENGASGNIESGSDGNDPVAGTQTPQKPEKANPAEPIPHSIPVTKVKPNQPDKGNDPDEKKAQPDIVETDSTYDNPVAQQDPSKPVVNAPTIDFNPKGKFELGMTINAGLVRQLIGANPSEEWKLNSRFLGIQEQSISRSAGYVIRLNGLYYLGEKTYISTGFSFTQKEENVSYDYMITEGVDVNTETRKIGPVLWDPDQYITVKFNNNNTYRFVEVPLRIGKIVPVSNKLEMRGEAGLNYMLMLGANGQTIDETYLTPVDLSKHQFMKTHVLGAGFKTGLYFTPENNWRFGAEVGFESAINSVYSNESAIKVNPFNYGLQFTANYLLINR